MTRTRDQEMLTAFAGLADTLVADYDVVDLLQNLVELSSRVLGATAAGVMLADEHGELDVIASTSEATRLVEVMQLSAYAGPCIESFVTGRVVSLSDIADSPERWRAFRDRALEQGFAAIDAVPMRLREETIGTLNLFRDSTGELAPDDLIAAQAFADVATIGILHQRTLAESDAVRQQLQFALNSRIVIEQAKGVVAQTRGVSIDAAFELIRGHARSNRIGISTVAAEIVDRRLRL
ncbi:GAF and ANTAR domain-containing protein [Leifsonia sp. AG29]|uniref:GAF and ANTAR domain-containing protein n=1 Tax=Leifsonia sp. AG29 TaxID=2598860 RepID=UPI00131A8527|nr:GAF and ANTAR domain-containing protein [Leifsonia sp. AG29]